MNKHTRNMRLTDAIVLIGVTAVCTYWIATSEPERAVQASPSPPQGIISTIRKAEAIIDRANETLDDFESKGVIVKPAEPEAPAPALPEPPTLIEPEPEPECSGGQCPVTIEAPAPATTRRQTITRRRPLRRLFRRCR